MFKEKFMSRKTYPFGVLQDVNTVVFKNSCIHYKISQLAKPGKFVGRIGKYYVVFIRAGSEVCLDIDMDRLDVVKTHFSLHPPYK